MPATPARIAFVRQEFRSYVWSDAGVQTLYGKVARDTGDQPIDTWFDDMTALLGRHARAFRTKVDELVDLDGAFAMTQALPGAQMVDGELFANLACAVVSIESYDTGAEQTTLATWGVLN